VEITKPILDSLWIAEKDLRGLLQLRLRLFLTVILPVLMLFIFNFRFGGIPLSEAPVAVAISDNGSEGFELARMLDGTSEIAVIPAASSEMAVRLLRDGEVYAAITVPEGFSKNIRAGVESTVELDLDDSNPLLAASIRSVVERVIGQFNEKMHPQLVKAASSFLYGTGLSYVPFLASGLVAMTTMFGAILQSLSIVWERSLRTLDRLLVAPVRSVSIMTGKILAGMMAGLGQALIILGTANLLFDVNLRNLPVILLVVFVSSFAFTGVGVLISCVAKDPREAAVYNQFLNWPMVFISGVFFPVEALPSWLQSAARLAPLTYSVEALRAIMIKGRETSFIALDMFVLICFAISTLYLGSRLLMRSETK